MRRVRSMAGTQIDIPDRSMLLATFAKPIPRARQPSPRRTQGRSDTSSRERHADSNGRALCALTGREEPTAHEAAQQPGAWLRLAGAPLGVVPTHLGGRLEHVVRTYPLKTCYGALMGMPGLTAEASLSNLP